VPHQTATTIDDQTAREIADAIVTQSGRFAGQSEAESTSGDAVIVVRHLTKQFGERVAFRDVSFSVNRGEVFGFLGPNGAGKTSTVRTLSTLVTATSGTASVAGIDLTPKNGFEIRERIAVMTELPGLYLRLTVTENLEFFAGLYGFRDASERIDRALEAVNLTSRAGDLSGSLSKGLRQRVGLARALLNDPQIIFLDEPTAGLDPVASLEVHDLINSLRAKGVTVFLTTHRLDEAEKLCDRVAILNTTLRTVGRIDDLRQRMFRKGIVVTTASPLANPDAVFQSVPSVESWKCEDGTYVVTVNDVRVAAPEVTRALVRADADVLSIVESRHSLEEVYLELVGASQRGEG
jgi:ABC-2 type transport system ATP-binding protein